MLESKLISLIKSLSPDPSFIGDDCAVIDIGEEKFLFTVDHFVEDVHYSEEYFSPEDIGWKAIAVNISDIAAMSGIPLWAMVGLSLSDKITDKETWVRKFYTGLNQCAKEFGGVKVIGGDITGAKDSTCISVSLIGKAFREPLLRSSAKPGDKVCVTGKFGNSASFLHSTCKNEDIQYHLRPKPRIKEAQGIWQNNQRGALMDASDGLAQALIELAEQSQVDIEINSGLIPLDKHINLSLALYGGEDYELVGCFDEIPPNFIEIGLVKNGSTTPKVKDSYTNQYLDKSKIYRHF